MNSIQSQTNGKGQESSILLMIIICDDNIQQGRDIASVLESEHHLSPNDAYFYMVQFSDTMQPSPWQFLVSIDNERDGFFQILFKNVHSYTDIKWINEKLLFIRVWWGRVLGTDLIVDVEKETIIYKEMVNGGNIPFQQWQQTE